METLFDPTSIGLVITIITTVLGIVATVIEKYKNNDLNGALSVAIDGYNTVVDLFDPAVPQTDAQTEHLNNIPARTWKMSDDNKDQLFRDLRNWGAEIRKGDLLAVIAKAEAESQVEYGIILHDHKGNIDRSIINEGKGLDQEHEVYHAFVSYGNTSVQTYDKTMIQVAATYSKTYPLEIYWYMTDDVKEQLILQIGTSNPKCIEEVTDKIRKMEDEQVEQYYVSCSYHTWEITRGNITRQFAGAKTEPPTPAISN
jgi:hypothetical protein